jgi:DNA modification methylase
MSDRIYSSTKRDSTINKYSHREFTKSDCLKWLDTLEDESVNLWILDPPYNVLTGNMTNKNGAAVFHSRYTAKVSPSESDLEKGIVTPRFEVAIPWEEKQKLDDYKETCYQWYCKAHQKLCDDSFMFIFWSMRYLYLAYQIFDVNRVIFWQQPNMVSSISGDFCYDITPIIVVRKGNPRLTSEAGLWDKSSVLNFTKPQGNYKKDKLCHPTQKPRALLEHLVWLSDADHEGNVIGDFFAGSGSLLRAVNKADVILCDMNREYYDKFFDINVTDPRVYTCKIIEK